MYFMCVRRFRILTFSYSTELALGSLLNLYRFKGMYCFAPLSLHPTAAHVQASLLSFVTDGGATDEDVLAQLDKVLLELDVLVHYVRHGGESLMVGMGEAAPAVRPSLGICQVLRVYIVRCIV